jgi:hypothetical protein
MGFGLAEFRFLDPLLIVAIVTDFPFRYDAQGTRDVADTALRDVFLFMDLV